ncbi:MAG: c-type cytochrome biogenesis protein CcsB, partial [Desulfobacca sp.]|nr:c-type cytochrome biogenesis protein CcsB [Desulfobacca sp.]
LSIMYLLKKPMTLKKKENQGLFSYFPDIAVLDDLIYQTIIIGFLLLTLGIVTGSIWAHSAWGTYWSWDPKETWSLITWLVYAALLHARMMKGWHGSRIAWLSIIGFACVLFTYFGVNFILSGLHSYGAA